MSGPAPKPTALKRLAGNPGHRPLNDAEAQPNAIMPRCPAHLSGEAKAEWHRIVHELHSAGLATKIDRAALAAYCQAWARWVEAEGKIEYEGMIVFSPNGYPMQNPWVQIANKALELMHKFLTEFGMTPAARTRIKVEKPKKEKSLAEELFSRVKAMEEEQADE